MIYTQYLRIYAVQKAPDAENLAICIKFCVPKLAKSKPTISQLMTSNLQKILFSKLCNGWNMSLITARNLKKISLSCVKYTIKLGSLTLCGDGPKFGQKWISSAAA